MQHNSSDIERLLLQTRPVGPGPSLRKRVLQAARSETAGRSPKTETKRRKTIQMLINTKTAAAVLITATLTGLLCWTSSDQSGSCAFANVVRPLIEANTITFDLTVRMKEQPGQVSKVYLNLPSRIRQELTNGDVNILDYDKQKLLEIATKERHATIREWAENDRKAWNTPLLMFDHIQNAITSGGAQSLGTSTIDGRKVIGFQSPLGADDPTLGVIDHGSLIIWADPDTHLPVRLEILNHVFGFTSVFDNIVLNPDLDDNLFSLDIPAGYATETKQTNPSAVKPANNEVQAIEGLRSWLAITDGRFPSSLTFDAIKDLHPEAKLTFHYKGWGYTLCWSLPSPDTIDNPTDKQRILELAAKLKEHFGPAADGFKAFGTLKNKSCWHYAGAGVTRDDVDAPVFWYRPADSTTYRAVYADLSVRTLSEEELANANKQP